MPPQPRDGGRHLLSFVPDGIESALEQAREAAGEKDVSIAGGPGTTNQYLAAGLIDELRLHVAPFVAGGGERLFVGVGDPCCGERDRSFPIGLSEGRTRSGAVC